MCKVYTGHRATSKIKHGLSTCKIDNSLAKARGLTLCTGGQPFSIFQFKDWRANSVIQDEAAYYELDNLDLSCLQSQQFSFLILQCVVILGMFIQEQSADSGVCLLPFDQNPLRNF